MNCTSEEIETLCSEWVTQMVIPKKNMKRIVDQPIIQIETKKDIMDIYIYIDNKRF